MATGREVVLDAMAAIRRRLDACLLIPPTVAVELAHMADCDPLPGKRRAAASFFSNYMTWGFRLAGHTVLGEDHVQLVADRLRERGLLPEREVNDSLIVVEASALDCSVLLTRDEHLRGMDYERLVFELGCFDLHAPVIATPRDIVKHFLR
jgi:hypothetical protein